MRGCQVANLAWSLAYAVRPADKVMTAILDEMLHRGLSGFKMPELSMTLSALARCMLPPCVSALNLPCPACSLPPLPSPRPCLPSLHISPICRVPHAPSKRWPVLLRCTSRPVLVCRR